MVPGYTASSEMMIVVTKFESVRGRLLVCLEKRAVFFIKTFCRFFTRDAAIREYNIDFINYHV